MEIGDYRYRSKRVEWERALHWSSSGDFCVYRARNSHGMTRWGVFEHNGARIAAEHGEKIMANNADLRLPWSLAPREGKYYGTVVLDVDGETVAEFWDHGIASPPSAREKEYFGEWTEEAWADYCCDSHWESERDYARAAAIVAAMNATLGVAQ